MSWQRIRVRDWGGPEVLQIEELDDLPSPGPREALVRVQAAGVGYTDTIVRRGKYIDYKDGLPVTPGYDLAGEVVALGSDTQGPAPGTPVCDMPMHGSYSEYVIRPAQDLIPVPGGVAAADAVQVPLMLMTAFQMLTREVDLPKGSWVLVVGASGSVGRALVKLAVERGLKVVGTASAHNLGSVEELGATAIDYHRTDLVKAIRVASGGGVLAAFDAIGGESWKTSWRALRRGGKLVGYGLQGYLESGAGSLNAISSFARLLAIYPLLGKLSGKSTSFYNILQRRWKLPEEYREDAVAVLDLLASGTIAPDPVEVLPLFAAPEAHRRIAAGGLEARLVLDPGT